MNFTAPISIKHGLLAATFAAILTALSFAPYDIWPLGFICLLPILWYYEKRETSPLKHTLLVAFIYCLVVDIIAFHWIIHTVTVFGHMPYAVAILIFLLYVTGTNLRFLFFFIFLHYWQQKISKLNGLSGAKKLLHNRFLMFTGAWAVCEYLGWQLFPWYGANLVSGNQWFIQGADLFGIQGLSVFWFLIQLSLYTIFNQLTIDWRSLKDVRQHATAYAGLLLLVAFHVYGAIADNYWAHKQQSFEKKHIGVPQGHTPLSFQEMRTYGDFQRITTKITADMVDQSITLANQAQQEGRPLDLIVWPESSVPFIPYVGNAMYKGQIARLQNIHPIQVVINDVYTDYVKRKRRDFSNMWLLDESGTPIENYYKVYLLPFGEYFPLSNTFTFLKGLIPELFDFPHGDRFVPMKSKAGEFMPLVCYEVIQNGFIWSFHQKTEKQARFFVNITNDSWFGKSIESSQHLALGRIRSIEFRLPMVRSTNAGISAQIDVTGRVSGKTPLFEKANAVYTLQIPQKSSSLFSLWGLIPLYVFITLVVGFGLWAGITEYRKYRAA